MQLGMVGLGRMGNGMTKRLEEHGQEVKTYDPKVPSTAKTLGALCKQLSAPRHVWLMIPAGEITEKAFQQLLRLLEPGDTIVDGGNSNFRDSQRRYKERASTRSPSSTSASPAASGAAGRLLSDGRRRRGGGETGSEPILTSLAPPGGYAHVGPAEFRPLREDGHKRDQYGLMQAYAEGFEVMRASEFDLDLREIAGIWRYGSVVRSWHSSSCTRRSSRTAASSESIRGYVEDSGEGRWTIHEAIAENVPVPVITAALFARFSSRQDESFAAKVDAALRNQFGGHAVLPERKQNRR
jgi:6-phosphogluconate dehydrogenase